MVYICVSLAWKVSQNHRSRAVWNWLNQLSLLFELIPPGVEVLDASVILQLMCFLIFFLSCDFVVEGYYTLLMFNLLIVALQRISSGYDYYVHFRCCNTCVSMLKICLFTLNVKVKLTLIPN